MLKIQPYIKNVICEKSLNLNNYDALDLGGFRNGKINMCAGDISLRYNFLKRSLNYYNVYQPWLHIDKNEKFDWARNKIVVFRSPRYRHNKISYTFLK